MKFDLDYAHAIFADVSRALGSDVFEPLALDYRDDAFPLHYAAHSLLKKWVLAPGSSAQSRASAAWDAFDDSEHHTARINRRTSSYRQNTRKGMFCEGVIFYACRKIRDILGNFDFEEFVDSVNHSGGASTQRNRSASSTKNKWSDIHHVTLQARPLYEIVAEHLHLTEVDTRLFPGAVGFTVPKDSRTDRLCFKEPQANMFMQKGIGAMIRRRLRRAGINLNDQSINQHMAGDYSNCTIDLRNASNNIACSIVRDLLQFVPQWLFVLDTTRSSHVRTPSGWRELEMYSGMGNGFTFELESLIFYALCEGVKQWLNEFSTRKVLGKVSVYGDDVICPAEMYPLVRLVFGQVGFRLNSDKSFADGRFRESCGSHYFDGANCTPIYVKAQRFNDLGDFYWLRNSLDLLAQRLHHKDLGAIVVRIDEDFKISGVLNYVPQNFGLRQGVHATFDVACPPRARQRIRKRSGRERVGVFDGFAAKILRPTREWYPVCQMGAYLQSLRSIETRVNHFHLTNYGLSGTVFRREPVPPTDIPQGHVEWLSGKEQFKWVEVPIGTWL